MLKYLRVTVTVLSLTACVLLIALWVRSYSWNDHIAIRTGPSSGAQRSNVVLLSNWGFLQALFNQSIDVENGIEYFNQPAWERTDVGFEWRDDGAIKVPDLFPIMIALSCGIAPWIPWSRRFSVRTLLIATTLVAVALAIIITL